MRVEDVIPGRWVEYTAGHARFGNPSRIGQIGQIVGFIGDEETKERNVKVDWLMGLHPSKETGGVYIENIELLGPQTDEEGEELKCQ